MAINDRLYDAAGITVDGEGVVKVRYIGDADQIPSRVKMYSSQGCKKVEFFELPKPMNKIEVCKYLLGKFEFVKFKSAIELEMGKKETLVTPKVPGKRGRKPNPNKVVAVKQPTAKKQPAVVVPKGTKVTKVQNLSPKKEIGEVEVLEVIEDTDSDDFDIRQFERMAAEQV